MHIYAHISICTCKRIAIPSNIKDNMCLCKQVSTSFIYCVLRWPWSLLSSIMCRLYTCSRFCGIRMNSLRMKRSSVPVHFWSNSHHQLKDRSTVIYGKVESYVIHDKKGGFPRGVTVVIWAETWRGDRRQRLWPYTRSMCMWCLINKRSVLFKHSELKKRTSSQKIDVSQRTLF